MFKYLATAAAVKFLVCRPGTEVPIHESLSTTSRSLGYELILAMCYITWYLIVIANEPPPDNVVAEGHPKLIAALADVSDPDIVNI